MKLALTSVARITKRISVIFVPLLALSLVSAPAQAAPMYGQFRNIQTGGCLDSNLRGEVYTLPCNSTVLNQYWEVEVTGTRAPDRYYQVRIKNAATNRYLSQFWHVPTNPFTAPTFRPTLTTQPNSSGDQAVFDGVGAGWNKVSLRSTKGNRFEPLCVDSGGIGVAYPHICNGGTWQKWELIKRNR